MFIVQLQCWFPLSMISQVLESSNAETATIQVFFTWLITLILTQINKTFIHTYSAVLNTRGFALGHIQYLSCFRFLACVRVCTTTRISTLIIIT